MGYTEFNAQLKKINLKPKGVKEIVLEISDGALAGKIDTLSEMIDSRISVSIESQIVRYNVQIDARNDKPITTYKVDDTGIVSEVKPEAEQLEADLGFPPIDVPIKQESEEIKVEVVDEFIKSGLAPTYDDLVYNFQHWIDRLHTGETHMKIASDENLSSGKVSELLDEYRKRVAPLAKAWDEWRKGLNEVPKSQEEEVKDTQETEENESRKTDDQEGEFSKASSVAKDDIELFILSEKPTFEDIPFDFPALLSRKRNGETWMSIANSLGVTSGQLSSKWNEYKSRVSKMMGQDGAA